MAKKKAEKEIKINRQPNPHVKGLRAEVLEQPVIETLEENYMPYAMSVIVSRAIPEIDGFKPSHRKLLYTMHKMGLQTGARTKSANIVGQTMGLNPHGDAAIYETMVRLSKGYGALLTPYVDSKGNFGKVYSRDMSYAASRYTEAKLSPICAELMRDIDKDTVDMVDNYDSTKKEPTLLPTTYPNVLVNANMGIAVGMASNICGFNLSEVCDTAIAYMKNPNCDLFETLKGPDFATGAEILWDQRVMEDIYSTGRGSFRMRAKWRYVKAENLIEVYELPYTTTAEAVIDKVAELVKAGKVKEINDMRDETDLGGLKLAIELKRGTDPEKLMAKLMKLTPLTDSFGCNFNILIAGMPRVMGVREILDEWVAWRVQCVKRRVYHELSGKKDKLHLLEGLGRILLDIDKAIAIIRETEEEAEVVPNLMIGFGIDEVQAEFVAEIKLRNINREYILKRTEETEKLRKEIEDLESTLRSDAKVKRIIESELKTVEKKYGEPRRTEIVYDYIEPSAEEVDPVEDYPVKIFLSREGYFKKISHQSLRTSGEQKYKDGDGLNMAMDATNRAELIVFTDRQQAYKCRLSDFDDGKASQLGLFLPQALGMDDGERPVFMLLPGDYSGSLMFFYENGKANRVPLSAYATKTNRKRLIKAYSDKSPLAAALHLSGDTQIAVVSTEGRAIVFSTTLVAEKATRDSAGVNVLTLKKQWKLAAASMLDDSGIRNPSRYRVKSIPAAGALLKPEDRGEEQLGLPV